ncbi:MAG: hypothetical protein O7B77_02525, partial [Actinobacteria bacterium]|nr:hypothetical protein [Actinomycetota bacterium]
MRGSVGRKRRRQPAADHLRHRIDRIDRIARHLHRTLSIVLAIVLLGVQVALIALAALAATPPAFRSVGTGIAAGATSIIISTPPGVVAGDIMIAQVAAHENLNNVTSPAGWSLIRLDKGGGGSITQGLWWKEASNSEPTSYTWTVTSQNEMSGAIAAYTGVDPGSPINAHGGIVSSNTTDVVAPSIVTTVSDTLLVGFWAVRDQTTVTPPGVMTERWDFDNA